MTDRAQAQATKDQDLGYVSYQPKGTGSVVSRSELSDSSWPTDAGQRLAGSARLEASGATEKITTERLRELSSQVAARPEISPAKPLPEHELAQALKKLVVETEAKADPGNSWLALNFKNMAWLLAPTIPIAAGLSLLIWGMATGHPEGIFGLFIAIGGGLFGGLASSENISWKSATKEKPWDLPKEGYEIIKKLSGKDDPKVADALLSVLNGKVAESAKVAAAAALGGIPMARASLIKTLHSENYELAAAAFKSLGELKGTDEINSVGWVLLKAKRAHTDTVHLPGELLSKTKEGEYFILKFIEDGPKDLIDQRKTALNWLDPHSLQAIKLARKLASGKSGLAQPCYEFLRK